MPYNYLLDEFLLTSYQEIIEDSIIIFDEAHNVSEAACEGRSLQLDALNIDTAILELNKILSKYLSPSLQLLRGRYHEEINLLLKQVEDLKETFTAFAKEMFAT
jgi:chromosome transmission fidelity protein 1